MDVEELSDIFYTNHRKGQVCRVKLNAHGFTLQRESNERTREQVIDLCDIVGSRCIVVRKERRACSMLCSSVSSLAHKHREANVDTKKKFVTPTSAGTACGMEEDASAYLYVFAYILTKKKNLRSVLRRERTVLKLRFRSFDTFEENMSEAERWHEVLKALKCHNLLGSSTSTLQSMDTQQRLLILLNPKAGSGKARELFHQQVAPVLNEAEQQYDLHVTKHANYARDFVRLRQLVGYQGIVAIGGDGLFFELLNGLLMRTDWQLARQKPLGIVPCGSGNGLARSLAHMHSEPYEPKPILGATLSVLSGKMAAMDVVRIEHCNQILYSFLSVGWGLISDIDIESERLRSLGYQRFTIWTLHRLISLRTYRGKISYLPKQNLQYKSNNGYDEDDDDDDDDDEDEDDDEIHVAHVLSHTHDTHSFASPFPLKHSKSCNARLDKVYDNCFQSSECISTGGGSRYEDVISLQTSMNQSYRSRCGSWFSAGSRKSTYHSISESIYHSVAGSDSDSERLIKYNSQATLCGPLGTVPTLAEPVPESWVVEEGEFVMVHAAYQTHLGTDCFFVPPAKLNDGLIYVIIIRGGISRTQLLNFLVSMSTGTHVPPQHQQQRNKYVKMVAVTAFRIEPQDNAGILTIDGERIECGPLQGEVLPGMVNVMVPK